MRIEQPAPAAGSAARPSCAEPARRVASYRRLRESAPDRPTAIGVADSASPILAMHEDLAGRCERCARLTDFRE
jgi:hypothetical protein